MKDTKNQRYTNDLAARLRQRQEELIRIEMREMAALLRVRQQDLFRRDRQNLPSLPLTH